MRYLVPLLILAAGAARADGLVLAGNTGEALDSPLDHAPIGVMGDHIHSAGEWMISYRFMSMAMEDNLRGSDSISPEEIIQTPNRFFGSPMQPPNLRVVPLEMRTDMHMLGAMYAPSDDLTLMVMANYLDKDMDLVTYDMMGREVGTFSTGASGLGDTRVAALWRLYEDGGVDGVEQVHLNLGLSLPTGSIDEEGRVLAPTGMTMTMRLPYAMQLGSGSVEFMPGITYTGQTERAGWGAQLRTSAPLDDNNEGYQFGSRTELTGWTAYRVLPWLSGSLRLTYEHREDIEGIDDEIRAPVQTADPDNYGGDWVNLGLGLNLVGRHGAVAGHRLALEYELPLLQDVNGIQMEMRGMLTLGYQYAF